MDQEIFITKNGKIIAKLTNPYQDCVEAIASPITDYQDTVVEKVASRKDTIVIGYETFALTRLIY